MQQGLLFVNKKKQKTFFRLAIGSFSGTPLVMPSEAGYPRLLCRGGFTKVFWFFFSKKNCFLSSFF
jgi:hypothetical protein